MSSSLRVLFVPGKRLSYGQSIAKALDSSYDVIRVNVWEMEEILRMKSVHPHLCIVEWSDDDIDNYHSIVKLANKSKVDMLVGVHNDDLRYYAMQVGTYIKDFFTIPVNIEELKIRISLETGTHPDPIAEGMTRLDNNLYVNFVTRVVRVGHSNYSRLTHIQSLILDLLFQNVNKFVPLDAINDYIIKNTWVDNISASNYISGLRKAIDIDEKLPKYILSKKGKAYAFCSMFYDGYDDLSIIGKTSEKLSR